MSFDKGKKIVFVIGAALVIGSLLTGAIMLLWNWLMPELFGLTIITFWQALGIFVLSKILFGGFMHKKHCSHCSNSGEKWKNMSSVDKHSLKEKFMQKWAHCNFDNEDSPENLPEEK